MIDSHTHLDSTPGDDAEIVARARELDAVLYDLADGLVAVAIALAPYLPETAPRILEALHQPEDLDWNRIANGTASPADGIGAAAPLFPRIEPQELATAAAGS